MKRLLTTVLINLFAVILIAQNFNEFYFKFTIESKSEINKLTQLISIDNVKGNEVYAYANLEEYTAFQKLGYKIELLQKGIPKVIDMAATVSEMENWDRYPTYEVYRQMLKNFETDYPSICKLDSFGTTVNGRQLYAIKISDNVNEDETEPEFFYTSTMHGDETTGYILLLRLIDSLLTSYGSEAEITNLVNNLEIFINPNANPDGTYRGGNNTVASATRSNANNKDINRDFPDPRIGANSPYQPETQAMMDYAASRNFIMSANFHGGAEVANYPWDTWTTNGNTHADAEWFIRICTNYVATARTVSPNYMKDVTSSGVTEGGDWYVITGGRQDYMNYWHKCREVTFEVSSTKLSGTENLNLFWNINKQSLLNFIKESSFGIRGFVKDAQGNPLKAMIFVNNYDEVNDSSMVFSNHQNGEYYRMLNSRTYSLTATKFGYIPKTINNITLALNNSVNVDFVLEEAQKYIISGNVRDALSENPLENVNIVFLNTNYDTLITDSNGAFVIENIYEGTYFVMLQKNGYTEVMDTITINSENLEFDFILFPATIEDFETGDFTNLNWQLSGNANWTIDNTIKAEGNYSAKSGVIGNSSSSVIMVELDLAQSGNMSFFRKVSSESGYDFLIFYIDDILKEQWSGAQDWKEFNYYVNEGLHTFKWVYIKDGYTTGGSDCAWIDYISFPYNVQHDTSLTISPLFVNDTLLSEEDSIHQIVIFNSGTDKNIYTISVENQLEHSWISLNKESDTILFQSSDTILVHLSNNALNPGNYSCNIIITEQDNDIYTIPVNLNVPVINNTNQDILVSNLHVFPNPFNDRITIQLNIENSDNIEILLYDINGNKILQKYIKHIEPGKSQIVLESLTSLNIGIYFITIKFKNTIYSTSILKY